MRRFSRTQLFGLDPLASSSYPTIRSLIAEIELRAHYAGAALQIIALHLNGEVVARVYCYEQRLGRLATGIQDGVIVLSGSWQPELLPWLCHRLQDFAPSDMASFRLIEEAAAHSPVASVVMRNRNMIAAMEGGNAQEILPLSDNFATFLERFGRSTRRNIARGLDYVRDSGVAFNFTADADIDFGPCLRSLAWNNMPHRQSFKRIASARSFVAGQPRPFGATLTDRSGRLISAASGFIENDLAVLVSQSNHRDYRDANPSLTLRSLVVERLIAMRATRLAFIGGCAGSFLRYCERVRGADLLLVRNRFPARLKHVLYQVVRPESRATQLSSAFASRAIADLPTAVEAEASRFDLLRSELKRVRLPRS